MKLIRLLPIVAALCMAACSSPGKQFRLEGDIAGVNQAEIFAYFEDAAFCGIDTIRIQDGHFVYEKDLTQPAILTLLYPNYSQTYIVAEPGVHIKMDGDAAKLGEAQISGSDENQLLTDFRTQIAGKSEAEARLAATNFIRQNKQTLAAVAVLKRYFTTAEEPEPATVASLLKDLCTAQPKNASLTMLRKQINSRMGGSKGQNVPSFETTTLDGKTITPSKNQGRPMAVVFWATWSNKSSQTLNLLQQLKNSYGGKVTFVPVSLDHDIEACRRATDRDSLTAITVCDGLAFESPVCKAFGIKTVPGCTLIDRHGRIIARDLTPDQLEQRIGELLK